MAISFAYKRCYYYGCDETQVQNSELTYFKFPPNAEKARIWAERAGVVVDQNLKNKYLCQKHFSPIYINKGSKRTALLNTAVPYALGEDDTNFEVPVNPIGMRTPRYHIKTAALNDVDSNQHGEVVSDGLKEHLHNSYDDESDTEYLVDDSEILIAGAADVADKPKANKKRTIKSTDNRQPLVHVAAKHPTQVQKCLKIEAVVSAETDDYSNMVEDDEEEVDENEKISFEIEQYDDEDIPAEATEETPETNGAECPSPEPEIPKDYFIFINQGEQWIQLPKKVYLEQRSTIKKLQRDVDTIQVGQRRKILQLQAELKRYKQFVRSVKGQFDKFEV
jgi:THAP domain